MASHPLCWCDSIGMMHANISYASVACMYTLPANFAPHVDSCMLSWFLLNCLPCACMKRLQACRIRQCNWTSLEPLLGSLKHAQIEHACDVRGHNTRRQNLTGCPSRWLLSIPYSHYHSRIASLRVQNWSINHRFDGI